MQTKTYKLNDVEYSTIVSALNVYCDFHFDRSKTLKRQADAQYAYEQFQKGMATLFELREQMKGQN